MLSNSTAAAADINVAYNLTQDGRYMLRAYRKNEYEGVLDGYIVETGVGFILSVDYDKFKEIFEKRKVMKQMNAANKERRRQEKQNMPPEKSANPPTNLPEADNRKQDPIDNPQNDEEIY